jgi:hypothetical protein
MIDNGGRRIAQRRVFTYHYHIPERRSGHDRRSGLDRRRSDRRTILDVKMTKDGKKN